MYCSTVYVSSSAVVMGTWKGDALYSWMLALKVKDHATSLTAQSVYLAYDCVSTDWMGNQDKISCGHSVGSLELYLTKSTHLEHLCTRITMQQIHPEMATTMTVSRWPHKYPWNQFLVVLGGAFTDPIEVGGHGV